MITTQESTAINSLRFICIVFLVLLHTQVSHLVPESNNSIRTIQDFVEIPFLQILFFISGFLFFYQKKDNGIRIRDWMHDAYITKLRKRIKTLLLPYLIWSVIAILYNHFIKKDPFPDTPGNFLMLFWDAGRGDGQPIGKALWYIKSLIVFSILSPIYLIAIKKLGHTVPLVFLALHYCGIGITFPFFNLYILLGAYVAIFFGSIDKILNKLGYLLCFVSGLCLKIFEIYHDIPESFTAISFILWLSALWGILYKYPVPSVVAASSSFVYFVHPYFTGIRNLYIKLADADSGISCATVWFLTAATVFLICYGLYFLAKKGFPKFAGILVGDRL